MVPFGLEGTTSWVLESCNGNFTLPPWPKPFGHLKLSETHTTWTPWSSVAELSGIANRCALSESSANHRAPFKHGRPSSNQPGTYWLLSNVVCWCHISTMFHSHPSKISALFKSGTKLYVLLVMQSNQNFIVGKYSTMVDNLWWSEQKCGRMPVQVTSGSLFCSVQGSRGPSRGNPFILS